MSRKKIERIPSKFKELDESIREVVESASKLHDMLTGTGIRIRTLACAACCEVFTDPDDLIDFGEGTSYCDECLPSTVTPKPVGLTMLSRNPKELLEKLSLEPKVPGLRELLETPVQLGISIRGVRSIPMRGIGSTKDSPDHPGE